MTRETGDFTFGMFIGVILTVAIMGTIWIMSLAEVAIVTPVQNGFVWEYRGETHVISQPDIRACAGGMIPHLLFNVKRR